MNTNAKVMQTLKYKQAKNHFVQKGIIEEDGIFLKGRDATDKWFWKPIFVAVKENIIYGTYAQFSQDFTFEPNEVSAMEVTQKGKKVFVRFDIRAEFVAGFNGFTYARLRLKLGKNSPDKVIEILHKFKSLMQN